ncbi:hypothetical protein mRhiFer1_010171 [Rhinolophus ferrumequinum]|uniref:Uncharacterized protein n=1 Tax=Rhinolophus ferrumequinum TaxID=59479 RepID=A0A7J7XPN3_RHIFE|nr:hypothetical protein mRhiFer1_010171 [Rhinolophus ferrumequinum]
MPSLSPLPPLTCSVSVCPHLPPFSLGPCDWLFGFFCCPSPKQEKLPATAAHPPAANVLPQSCPHGSIHHSRPHPGSTGLQQREGASQPPREELQPPTRPPPWSSALLLASQLWALSYVLPKPQGEGKGRKGGGSWGRGKREEGERHPSLIS